MSTQLVLWHNSYLKPKSHIITITCYILLCTHYPTTITPYLYKACVRFCHISICTEMVRYKSHMGHSLLYPETDTHTSDISTHTPTLMDICQGILSILSPTGEVPYSGPGFWSNCHPFHYTNHIHWIRSQVIIGTSFHYLGLNMQTWVTDQYI